jgi:hypothetical protein
LEHSGVRQWLQCCAHTRLCCFRHNMTHRSLQKGAWHLQHEGTIMACGSVVARHTVQ